MWRDLLDSGAVIASGTDAPVEPVDPLASYYAAVTRRLQDGTDFYPAQVMTRVEALRARTLDAAYAAFEEDIKGSLTPGKLADLVVLSADHGAPERRAGRLVREWGGGPLHRACVSPGVPCCRRAAGASGRRRTPRRPVGAASIL